jgi:outer membrane protein OmpA-like peptidoglycan-associated protein
MMVQSEYGLPIIRLIRGELSPMAASANRTDLRRTLLLGMVAVLACSFTGTSASAQEKPSLKEILGRAQSESERKAVEDLIGKLRGKAPQPKPQIPEIAKPEQPITEPKQGEDHGATDERPEKAATTISSQTATETPAAVGKPHLATEGDPSAAITKTQTEQPAASTEEEPSQPKIATKPVSETADVALEKAERKQLPSVDLEVLFEYKSAELTPAAVETLSTLGRALIDERLAGGTFLIGGHTDAKGSADYNLHLSQRRAESVRQFLIATFAIDAGRLTAKGFGKRYLKNPQRPRSEENRRVQIVNVSPQAAR